MTITSLAGMVELHRGQSYKSALLDEPGPYLLGLGTIARNGGFAGGSLRTYGGDSPDRILVRPGDLYLSLKDVTHKADLLGAVARVPDNVRLGRLTQDTVRLQITSDEVSADYLYWLLQAPDYRAYCRLRGTGTTNLDLSRADFLGYEFRLPPLPEQQAIAEVLGALDDKIAANTALAATADSVAATEFQTHLRRAEVRDEALADVATIVLGGTPSRARPEYWTDGTVPWLNSGAVNATRIVEPSEYITAQALSNSAAKIMPSGSTLLAITGATLGQIARLEIEASGNQSIVGIWSTDAAMNTWLYFAIQARLEDLLARATGAAQQHVSKGDVEQLVVPVPSQGVLLNFSTVATPLLELAALLERENRTLAATRDALLPRLMSGKLRVRDAVRAVEQVV